MVTSFFFFYVYMRLHELDRAIVAFGSRCVGDGFGMITLMMYARS